MRMQRKNPGLTLDRVFTPALNIGAMTDIFGVV
jgi:hypothetical protein